MIYLAALTAVCLYVLSAAPKYELTVEQLSAAKVPELVSPRALLSMRCAMLATNLVAHADKWRRVTLPASLSTATVALARQLGYEELPLQLPPELVWLQPPKQHSSAPPSRFMLCIHPFEGVLDLLSELTSLLPLACLGFRLCSRQLVSCTSIAHLEQRYWKLIEDAGLWSGVEDADDGLEDRWHAHEDESRHPRPGLTSKMRCLLGISFGCRIAFSFAARLDKAGCLDVRVILIDGRVAEQPKLTCTINCLRSLGNDGRTASFGNAAAEESVVGRDHLTSVRCFLQPHFTRHETLIPEARAPDLGLRSACPVTSLRR